jgi:hypothetical protein
MANQGGGNQGGQGEFHRADPAYRRQMQVMLLVVVAIGALALVGLQLWLRRLGAGAGDGDLFTYQAWLNRLLAGLALMLAIASAGFAQWLYRMARAAADERRWPPSTMRTSSDVRIRYLTSADALVSQIRGTAVALAVLSAVLAAWAIWLFLTA